jgi:outer membrane receptor protein involved in Fe transport
MAHGHSRNYTTLTDATCSDSYRNKQNYFAAPEEGILSNNDHNKLNLGDQSDFWGKTSRFALIASALVYMGAPGIASANDDIQQEAPSAQAQSEPESDRNLIIVTATKRDQTLEEVPIAVTVVGQEELISKGIEDITNLERAAPSYAVSTSDSATGGLVLRLRGVGTTGNNIGLESSVGAFIDGFYLPRPGAALSDLYDVQQIELLKGPQGTLFGRNTSAGAMVIKTNPPRTDIVEGFVNATIGNYDLYGVQAGFNVPLVQDKIGLRIAGAYRNRGGYITNVVGDESQTRDRISIRGQLLFDLEDAGELPPNVRNSKCVTVVDPFTYRLSRCRESGNTDPCTSQSFHRA